MTTWTFPFGQPVKAVVQTDRNPKKVFVLGVYSSAVHAIWIAKNGKKLVNALAVASEPSIFWRGEEAERVISQISVPSELGKLFPANRQFNGPSGLALDELILNPLGIDRGDAWLCDLVPHSCMNERQEKAIQRAYMPIADQYRLAKPTLPPVPKFLADDVRRHEILEEIKESCASTLILLGDEPITWFFRHFDPRWKKLADFGESESLYGRLHFLTLAGKEMAVLPLAHPRQVAKLGRFSQKWYHQHQLWLLDIAGNLL